MTTTPAARSASDWNLSVLGGLRRTGLWTVARRIVLVTLVGGMSLDLREATFEADETVVTKISLVGGVTVRARDGVRVEAHRFSLLGGSRVDGDHASAPTEHVVRVRSFALVGGIHVE